MTRYSQNWLPNVFNDFFDNNYMPRVNATAPSINVAEDNEHYHVEVAAPGMTKDDFNIHLDENGDLVINMEKKTNSTRARSTCVASLLTLSINRRWFCPMMLTRQRLVQRLSTAS